ncbi:MAG: sensor histidine kinase [Bacteroidia bacterium]
MDSKRFRIQVALRVLLIFCLASLSSYLLFIQKVYFASGLALLLLVVTTISLIQFAERISRTWERFLLAIRHGEYTASFNQTFKSVEGKSNFYEVYNLITNDFKRIRMEMEAKHEFLKLVLEHIPIGLLCIDHEDNLVIFNEEAAAIVGVSHLNSIAQLKQIRPELYAEIQKSKQGQPHVFELNAQQLHIRIRETKFTLNATPYRLISFQNIRYELDIQEMESWQKLIRVLTHEIMNSITPISSLSATLNALLKDANDGVLRKEDLEEDALIDLAKGLEVIQRRSDGLLNFVGSYRAFMKLPVPQFSRIKIQALLDNVCRLMQPKMDAEQIKFVVPATGGSWHIHADGEQLEQVLINLLKNAIEAVEGRKDKTIRLLSYIKSEHDLAIAVEDNGIGIDEAHLQHIFVPFYTTKVNGSGIGLSICKQLIQLNGGSLLVQSNQNRGSVFEVVFLLHEA